MADTDERTPLLKHTQESLYILPKTGRPADPSPPKIYTKRKTCSICCRILLGVTFIAVAAVIGFLIGQYTEFLKIFHSETVEQNSLQRTTTLKYKNKFIEYASSTPSYGSSNVSSQFPASQNSSEGGHIILNNTDIINAVFSYKNFIQGLNTTDELLDERIKQHYYNLYGNISNDENQKIINEIAWMYGMSYLNTNNTVAAQEGYSQQYSPEKIEAFQHLISKYYNGSSSWSNYYNTSGYNSQGSNVDQIWPSDLNKLMEVIASNSTASKKAENMVWPSNLNDLINIVEGNTTEKEYNVLSQIKSKLEELYNATTNGAGAQSLPAEQYSTESKKAGVSNVWPSNLNDLINIIEGNTTEKESKPDLLSQIKSKVEELYNATTNGAGAQSLPAEQYSTESKKAGVSNVWPSNLNDLINIIEGNTTEKESKPDVLSQIKSKVEELYNAATNGAGALSLPAEQYSTESKKAGVSNVWPSNLNGLINIIEGNTTEKESKPDVLSQIKSKVEELYNDATNGAGALSLPAEQYSTESKKAGVSNVWPSNLNDLFNIIEGNITEKEYKPDVLSQIKSKVEELYNATTNGAGAQSLPAEQYSTESKKADVSNVWPSNLNGLINIIEGNTTEKEYKPDVLNQIKFKVEELYNATTNGAGAQSLPAQSWPRNLSDVIAYMNNNSSGSTTFSKNVAEFLQGILPAKFDSRAPQKEGAEFVWPSNLDELNRVINYLTPNKTGVSNERPEYTQGEEFVWPSNLDKVMNTLANLSKSNSVSDKWPESLSELIKVVNNASTVPNTKESTEQEIWPQNLNSRMSTNTSKVTLENALNAIKSLITVNRNKSHEDEYIWPQNLNKVAEYINGKPRDVINGTYLMIGNEKYPVTSDTFRTNSANETVWPVLPFLQNSSATSAGVPNESWLSNPSLPNGTCGHVISVTSIVDNGKTYNPTNLNTSAIGDLFVWTIQPKYTLNGTYSTGSSSKPLVITYELVSSNCSGLWNTNCSYYSRILQGAGTDISELSNSGKIREQSKIAPIILHGYNTSDSFVWNGIATIAMQIPDKTSLSKESELSLSVPEGTTKVLGTVRDASIYAKLESGGPVLHWWSGELPRDVIVPAHPVGNVVQVFDKPIIWTAADVNDTSVKANFITGGDTSKLLIFGEFGVDYQLLGNENIIKNETFYSPVYLPPVMSNLDQIWNRTEDVAGRYAPIMLLGDYSDGGATFTWHGKFVSTVS